jgi:hypothetical protein
MQHTVHNLHNMPLCTVQIATATESNCTYMQTQTHSIWRHTHTHMPCVRFYAHAHAYTRAVPPFFIHYLSTQTDMRHIHMNFSYSGVQIALATLGSYMSGLVLGYIIGSVMGVGTVSASNVGIVRHVRAHAAYTTVVTSCAEYTAMGAGTTASGLSQSTLGMSVNKQ